MFLIESGILFHIKGSFYLKDWLNSIGSILEKHLNHS